MEVKESPSDDWVERLEQEGCAVLRSVFTGQAVDAMIDSLASESIIASTAWPVKTLRSTAQPSCSNLSTQSSDGDSFTSMSDTPQPRIWARATSTVGYSKV